MAQCTYASPVGAIELAAQSGRLIGLRFVQPTEEVAPQAPAQDPSHEPTQLVLDVARRQLDAYFAGKLKRFDLPLAMQGTTFQLRVWSELARIPFGKMLSYKDLAWLVGNPQASRAVGSANGANPLAIIVPCHRVIAADGSLAGFAGGVGVKRKLLNHEGVGAGLFVAACG